MIIKKFTVFFSPAEVPFYAEANSIGNLGRLKVIPIHKHHYYAGI